MATTHSTLDHSPLSHIQRTHKWIESDLKTTQLVCKVRQETHLIQWRTLAQEMSAQKRIKTPAVQLRLSKCCSPFKLLLLASTIGSRQIVMQVYRHLKHMMNLQLRPQLKVHPCTGLTKIDYTRRISIKSIHFRQWKTTIQRSKVRECRTCSSTQACQRKRSVESKRNWGSESSGRSTRWSFRKRDKKSLHNSETITTGTVLQLAQQMIQRIKSQARCIQLVQGSRVSHKARQRRISHRIPT